MRRGLSLVERCRAFGKTGHERVLNMAHWRETYTLERWREVLSRGVDEEALSERIRCATLTGRPFGSEHFMESL